jgi:tRNA threonylcarbamoyladenosine biosynthesis protein TsaE
MEKRISIATLEGLSEAAELFLESVGDIPLIAFSGEMGAGKTTFIQALCRAMGIRQEVNSPTFSLVNEYFTENGDSVFHFDLYRIEDPDELFDLGYEEYFYSGQRCFIEWPEKASHLIPDEALMVRIEVEESGVRQLSFELPAD